jgi:hypothetical protein
MSFSSLQHTVMSQKNVPVYLDDGSKKQILITGTSYLILLSYLIILSSYLIILLS